MVLLWQSRRWQLGEAKTILLFELGVTYEVTAGIHLTFNCWLAHTTSLL